MAELFKQIEDELSASTIEIYRWHQIGVEFSITTTSNFTQDLQTIKNVVLKYGDELEKWRVSGICDIRVNIVPDTVDVPHFETYQSGLGSELMNMLHELGQKLDKSTITLWIGTKNGEQTTIAFLEKFSFDYYEDDSDAHGKTFHAEKKIQ